MYKIKNKHVFVKKKEKKNFQNPTNSSFLPTHFFSVQKKKPTYQLYQARVIVKTSHNHLL